MLPKPDHLGPEYGSQFADPSVVAAYGYRPPYPDEVLAPVGAGVLYRDSEPSPKRSI